MIIRVSEVIRGWLGWCPNQEIPHFRKETIPRPQMNSSILPVQGAYLQDGMIIDNGKTGISLSFFIGSVTGIIGLIVFLRLIVQTGFFPLAGILFCGLILTVVIDMVYQDLKKARLEITQDTLIIRRSLHRPVVIRKDTISAMEIRNNLPSIPPWLQKVLVLLMIPALSAGVLYGEYLQLTTHEITPSSFFVHLGFTISIVLFFLAIYYHSRVRSSYPSALVINTDTKEQFGIYGKNPEEIAKILGKSL
ncbi:MAG: hypothetical protein Q7T80_10650 [Methanoregula sp.]|nr:hypothetical protein [Methanoregula sp.]